MTSRSNTWTQPCAAYVHVPFCLSKCHYCDFNSYPGMESLFDAYVRAVLTEIDRERVPPEAPPLETVYVGGGTPTLLAPSALAALLRALADKFGLSDIAEVSVEANPGTVDVSGLASLRAAGFNRISIGVQSLDDGFLGRLGRVHTGQQAVDAFRAARSAGFENVSLDLIFALPGQSLSQWINTLETAVSLGPEHISAYELTIEEGTRFGEIYAQGSPDLPSEEEQLRMYEAACDVLSPAGYERYEVSNYARPGFTCRHNMAYWRNEPYYGFGAGATGCVDGVRAKRVSDPAEYVQALSRGVSVIESWEKLEGKAALAETVIQWLRLTEGINLSEFADRFGAQLPSVFPDQVSKLVHRGLLEMDQSHLRVTGQGLLLLNIVASEFLPEHPS